MRTYLSGRDSMFLILGILLVLRFIIFKYFPVGLWNSGDDYPVMSLAHAIYLDERLTTDTAMHVSYAQTAHPGIPFQIISWAAYRIVSLSIYGGFNARLSAVLNDSTNFSVVTQLIPLIVLWITIVLCRKILISNLYRYYGILTIAVYFSVEPVFNYGFLTLGNDTFALPLGLTFLCALKKANSGVSARSSIWWFISGVIGGLCYLNKLNYISWPIGVIFGYLCAGIYLKFHVKRLVGTIFMFVVGFLMSIIIIGLSYLGGAGFKEMLIRHSGFLTHSGLYGQGPETVVIPTHMLNNAISSILNYPLFWLLLLLIFSQVLFIIFTRGKDDRFWLETQLPLISCLLGSALLTLLAALKHYLPHYLIPLAAIFVCIGWWLGSQTKTRFLLLALTPFIVLAFSVALYESILGQYKEQKTIQATMSDIKDIHELPLGLGETRLWTYHVSSKEYMQYFLATLADSPYVTQLINSTNPVDKEFDIFGRYEDKSLDKLNWRYAIFQIGYFGSFEKLPDYFKRNGAILIKLGKLLVVENVKFHNKL